ncbi:MAG: metallophosphoesterase [Planctomycetota bacterium]
MTRPITTPITTSPEQPLRLALISDPHIWRLGVWPWQLVGKRAVGWLNLVTNRRKHFSNAGFPAALQRATELGAGLVVVNGDLTQTALPSEFRAAERILAACDLPAAIVPGNHDRYTHGAVWSRRFERRLGAQGGVTHFPSAFALGAGVRLIALDPCKPDLRARGYLPDAQLAGLVEQLRDCRECGDLPLIACHYPCTSPPEAPVRRGHELINGDALLAVLAAHPQRVIVFSGHIHRTWCWQPRNAGNVISLNPGPCGFRSAAAPHGLGFMEVLITREPDARLEVRVHRRDAAGEWQSVVMLARDGLLQSGSGAAGS